jgi:hypothetical protein
VGGEGSKRDECVWWRNLVEKERYILVISHNGCTLFVYFLRKRQKIHSNDTNPIVKHHLSGLLEEKLHYFKRQKFSERL